MTFGEALVSVWQQALADEEEAVEISGNSYAVTFTRAKKLRTVRFRWQEYSIDGIEQNPETSSRWAVMARQGKRVMQFSYQRRYIGNVCEGELLRYAAWRALALPE
jgi:hypothetical protein